MHMHNGKGKASDACNLAFGMGRLIHLGLLSDCLIVMSSESIFSNPYLLTKPSLSDCFRDLITFLSWEMVLRNFLFGASSLSFAFCCCLAF